MIIKGYKRNPYRLNGKLIVPKNTKKYIRKRRPRGKKKLISNKYSLYTLRDEYGRYQGSKKPK